MFSTDRIRLTAAIENEKKVGKILNHKNVVKFYAAIDDKLFLYFVFEYVDGMNLEELVKRNGRLSEGMAKKFFIQLMEALVYLKREKVVHRDISPGNIIITADNVLKVCDFGWAEKYMENRFTTYCGTSNFMAPEIIETEDCSYDSQVDVYSAGALLYFLLNGVPPFNLTTEEEVLEARFGEVDFTDECWEVYVDGLCDLLKISIIQM
ncbi:hypothetical protein HK098_003830 [Nowakowskiella sp. JEL0407]|nr:hypothetical protein HK098_003830 [Nowakowskiella sp. JEL0407]